MTLTFKDLCGKRKVTLADLVNNHVISAYEAALAARVKKQELHPYGRRMHELLEARGWLNGSGKIPEEQYIREEDWIEALEGYFKGVAGNNEQFLLELDVPLNSRHMTTLRILCCVNEDTEIVLNETLRYNMKITESFFDKEVDQEFLKALEYCWFVINPFEGVRDPATEKWIKTPLKNFLCDIAEAQDYSLRQADTIAQMLRKEAVIRGENKGEYFLLLAEDKNLGILLETVIRYAKTRDYLEVQLSFVS